MSWIVILLLSVFLSIFSTTVMSYISMATPIGPWIAPTVVLCAMLLLKMFRVKDQIKPLSFIAVSSSVGGILATACGFSFPTLYFLDPALFTSWMAQPVYFAAVLTGLSFVAGLFGIVVANALEDRLIVKDQLAFPIGQLIYKMIAASKQIKKAYELMIGFVSAAIFSIFQDGLAIIPRCIPTGFIPKSITLVSAIQGSIISIPQIQFDMWPMLWAIGFITGHVIALPLAVGAVSRILLVDSINMMWFGYLTPIEFSLAFCSGMVLYGVVMSFATVPSMLSKGFRLMKERGRHSFRENNNAQYGNLQLWVQIGLACLLGVLFFRYFQFSFLSILFLYAASLACIYQIAVIAGKIGIAPLGRFATFVMVPAMLIFKLDVIQIVFVSTFVEISGGVTADILFGRKMARLAAVDRRIVGWYQFGGLVLSSLVVGLVFWLLINHLQLGSPQLFAYKAQSRQLLIHASQFNYVVLVLGAIFSFFLKQVRVNPVLVLGGLLMPINISLGLIFGGILTFFVAQREEWDPFWSGVFASSSIWMLLRSVFG